MAKAKARALPRILMLLVLIAFLVAAGILWFDLWGLIDARKTLRPVLEMVGFPKTEVSLDGDDPLLLEKQRMKKEQEALLIDKEKVTVDDQGLKKRQEDLDSKENLLTEKEKALEEREKSFNEIKNQYENKNANLDQNARYLVGMKPDKAVKILNNMELVEVVEVLTKVEEIAKSAGEASMVSYWLYLMEPDRAAKVQSMMVRRDGS